MTGSKVDLDWGRVDFSVFSIMFNITPVANDDRVATRGVHVCGGTEEETNDYQKKNHRKSCQRVNMQKSG